MQTRLSTIETNITDGACGCLSASRHLQTNVEELHHPPDGVGRHGICVRIIETMPPAWIGAPRGVLPSTGRNSRPHLRESEFPRVRPQSYHRRHCPLEHDLFRPCRPAVTRTESSGSRRSARPCRTPRMGAYRSDRRLRLDRSESHRAVSTATRGSFYVPAPGGLACNFEQIVW
jgi:hypothetical protein